MLYLYVQQHYFLHAHSNMAVDVLAAAILGTTLGSSSVADLFRQDQTHQHCCVYYHAKLSESCQDRNDE